MRENVIHVQRDFRFDSRSEDKIIMLEGLYVTTS